MKEINSRFDISQVPLCASYTLKFYDIFSLHYIVLLQQQQQKEKEKEAMNFISPFLLWHWKRCLEPLRS